MRTRRHSASKNPDHEPRATEYVPQMLDLIGDWRKTAWLTRRPLAT
jgi:hypothetical protein